MACKSDLTIAAKKESDSKESKDPFKLSNEVSKLSGVERERYIGKLNQLGIPDPYLMPPAMFTDLLQISPNHLPDFDYHDLYHYVIFNPSPYTGKDLKAFKSMDAYQYFICGWVSCVRQWGGSQAKDFHLITGKVNHSQRLSDEPLKPWVTLKKDGQVINGHCTCMAGLGEVCSHVVALLFAVEAGVKHVTTKPCTSGLRQWGQVPAKGGAEMFAEGSEISFGNPQKRKVHQTSTPSQGPAQRIVCPPTTSERERFYRDLKESGVRSAVLSILPGYAGLLLYQPSTVLAPIKIM